MLLNHNLFFKRWDGWRFLQFLLHSDLQNYHLRIIQKRSKESNRLKALDLFLNDPELTVNLFNLQDKLI